MNGIRNIAKRTKCLAAGLAAGLALAALSASGASDEQTTRQAATMDDCIVRVIVTYQTFDPAFPWQKRSPGTRYGYGCLISSNRLITTESLVRNQTLVELEKPRSGAKYPARVEVSDPDTDLAVLRIERPGEMAPLEPLELATSVPPNAELQIIQFDETDKVEMGTGRIINIAVAQLPDAEANALTFKVSTTLDVNGQGCVALYHGQIAGLLIAFDSGARIATLLPYPVLARFLDDVAHPPYRGTAIAGFAWQSLADPAKREYLGVEGQTQGIVVSSVFAGTDAAGKLQSEDVILEWDGFAVDSLGFYKDPDFGRLTLPYLIGGRRKPGETVSMKVIRNHENMDVEIKLARRTDDQSLVPANTTGQQVEYLVAGGFIIRELGFDYLGAFGDQWEVNAEARLVHEYMTRRFSPKKPGDRIVIVTQVLPDPINVGYQHLRDVIVTHVNNMPVRNISDVFAAVDRDGKLTRLRMKSIDLDIVIDGTAVDEAGRNLAKAYAIPRLRFQRGRGEKNGPGVM